MVIPGLEQYMMWRKAGIKSVDDLAPRADDVAKWLIVMRWRWPGQSAADVDNVDCSTSNEQ